MSLTSPVSPAGREIPVVYPYPDQGLTSQQAAERAAAGYANVEVASPTKSEKQIVFDNVFTFFNLIFVVLAV